MWAAEGEDDVPWWVLLLELWVVWAVCAVLQAGVDAEGRRVTEPRGVSVAPVLPFFPLGLFALAKLGDLVAAPWGTWVIGAGHAALGAVFVSCTLVIGFSAVAGAVTRGVTSWGRPTGPRGARSAPRGRRAGRSR